MANQDPAAWSAIDRDGPGDTIFAIDAAAESILLRACADWARDDSFVLFAEGIEPEGRRFGSGPPRWRVIADPIDGTRGLMHDKRSAWSLFAVAPEKGQDTRLADVVCAAMTELPTTRQNRVDVLCAERGRGVRARRLDLDRGTESGFVPRPSPASDLRHGFASVANYFPGGKELTARLDEALMAKALGPWHPDKCEVYTDQYISSGGQLAELVLGRDRFVLDVRPLVHAALGVASSLCSRPYDLCTALVAEESGCVVRDPRGGPLDVPLDVTTSVAFAGYANAELARRLAPLVAEVVHSMLCAPPAPGTR